VKIFNYDNQEKKDKMIYDNPFSTTQQHEGDNENKDKKNHDNRFSAIHRRFGRYRKFGNEDYFKHNYDRHFSTARHTHATSAGILNRENNEIRNNFLTTQYVTVQPAKSVHHYYKREKYNGYE
jgi:hypothetical protein